MAVTLPERVTAREVSAFCRQFATMSKANVNLLDILRTLGQQTDNEWFRRILASVRRDVEYGRSLASAFSRFPADFSPFFIQMVRQGEVEGLLGDVFQSLAQYMDRDAGLSPLTQRLGVSSDVSSIFARSRDLLAWLSVIGAAALLGAGGLWFLTLEGWLARSLLGPELLMLAGAGFLMAALAFMRFLPTGARRCSFCSREEGPGMELVAGQGVAICSTCVAFSVRQLKDRPGVPGQVASPIPEPDLERVVEM